MGIIGELVGTRDDAGKRQGPLWILPGSQPSGRWVSLQRPLCALSTQPPTLPGPGCCPPVLNGLRHLIHVWSSSIDLRPTAKETENMGIQTFQPCFPHDAHKVGNSSPRGIRILGYKKQKTQKPPPQNVTRHQGLRCSLRLIR